MLLTVFGIISASENLNFEERSSKFSCVLCYFEENHEFFINGRLHTCTSNLPNEKTEGLLQCFNVYIKLVLLMKNRAVFEIAESTLQATSIFMLLFPKSVGKEEPVI